MAFYLVSRRNLHDCTNYTAFKMSFQHTDADQFIQRWHNHCDSDLASALKTDVDSSREQVYGCITTHACLIKFQGNVKDKHKETNVVQDTRNKQHVILK